jgi:MFS family permease
MLVGFRLVQAAGAALMTPTSLGLLLSSFPADRRGGAVRTWTAIGGFAAALGPLVGGLLVTLSWRWIFLVNVPIGIFALWIGWKMLPDIPGHDAPKPHPFAAALVTAGVGLLAFTIVKVNDWGWTSPAIGVTFGLALVCLVLFVAHCLRSENPFVDPALFQVRQFTGVAIAMALFSSAFGSMLLSIVLWDQMMWGWSALHIGLAIAPGPLSVR